MTAKLTDIPPELTKRDLVDAINERLRLLYALVVRLGPEAAALPATPTGAPGRQLAIFALVELTNLAASRTVSLTYNGVTVDTRMVSISSGAVGDTTVVALAATATIVVGGTIAVTTSGGTLANARALWFAV